MREKNVFVFVVRVRGESIVFVRRGEGKRRVRVREAWAKIVFVDRVRGLRSWSWDVFVFGEG